VRTTRKRNPERTSSDLTPQWRDHALARRRIARVARALERAYGTPKLGNLPDPLDEAAYIILTFQTDIPRARLVWTALKAHFPSWREVLDAPDADLASVLRPSGFHFARARLLKAMLREVVRLIGELSLDVCRRMTTEDAEALLRSLPGLDRKGARCVLLYSLDRAVLPIDSNAYRFSSRYGILKAGTRYRRASVHDALQRIVPPRLRHDLHVNLVVHGQQTCTPRAPNCPGCPVRRSCVTGRDVVAAGDGLVTAKRAARSRLNVTRRRIS
jgi:endonuclease III